MIYALKHIEVNNIQRWYGVNTYTCIHMLVHDPNTCNRSLPFPASQNKWRWRSWGGEADAAHQPKPVPPAGSRHDRSRTASAGSDLELTTWTNSATSGSYPNSHSDTPDTTERTGLSSPNPPSTSRQGSMHGANPGGETEDANSVHTQAGSVPHSFTSLHSMLQELDAPLPTAAASQESNGSSHGTTSHYKPR